MRGPGVPFDPHAGPDPGPTHGLFASRIRAVLGPTNTGKTHLAITRMLGFNSGIIGFPLRLLARENYERMVAAKGPHLVALITGEEKIVPPNARWFSCTVEAMPLDRPVEFVAVDEIQLCADPDRGHVFTDRLLRARGLAETMFLGAETILPLIRRLVPRAVVETRPRLSILRWAGHAKLGKLPPRSAIVAFSAQEVYAIAEAVRRRRGGCAVVMGRLSPRTRNAQVALYQAREVDFLVATDAIGMGLNMDVNHVAFAATVKFDGRQLRPLHGSEVAQIAGRAGRGMTDGTFGTTGEASEFPPDILDQVENHRFDPLPSLHWRNAELDFRSLDSLLDSLGRPPPVPGLVRGADAVDHQTLSALAKDQTIRGLAASPTRLRLLWQTCQIPDFRKTADDSHIRLVARVFQHLAGPEGRVPFPWLTAQLETLARIDGDIETLMGRLSHVRTWAYIAQGSDWVERAADLQARAREVEDLLSDALHERLTARFVDRRSAHLIRKLAGGHEELLSAVTKDGEVVVEGHPVGRIEGFTFTPLPVEGIEDRRALGRAARRALAPEIARRVAALLSCSDDALTLSDQARIVWRRTEHDRVEVARLLRGSRIASPRIEPFSSEFLDQSSRDRIRERIARWFAGHRAQLLGGLDSVARAAAVLPSLRASAFLLTEGLGLAPALEPRPERPARLLLRRHGIEAGRLALFLPALLKPKAARLRAILWAVHHGSAVPEASAPSLVSLPAKPDSWPEGFAGAMGWIPAGPLLLRLDIAERVAGDLAHLVREGPAKVPDGLSSRLGCSPAAIPAVLRALGFRTQLSEDGALLVRAMRRKTASAAEPVAAKEAGPFGALVALRR